MEVSVAMCTFNGAAFLAEQLQSLAAQDRLPDELVVCDDGSSDATPSILRGFAARAPFPVRLEINRQNLGSPQNFAKAVSLCRGRIIFLADQDDAWKPQKVRRLAEVISADPGIGFAFSDARLVDAQGEPSGHTLWQSLPFEPAEQARFNTAGAFDLLLRRNVVTGTTMAFRSDYRELLLPVPSGWVHDGWFALLLAAVARGWADSEPLVDYRQHARQQIGAPPETLLDKYRRRKRQGLGLYAATADNYAQAWERLSRAEDRLLDRSILAALADKIDHWRTRARMRIDPAWRAPTIARELLRGSYERYSAGWKSVAEDILL
jgi:glycosyltransferase involved in cell wall biosynthesis